MDHLGSTKKCRLWHYDPESSHCLKQQFISQAGASPPATVCGLGTPGEAEP